MIRKIFIIFLSLFLLIISFPISAYADDYEYGDNESTTDSVGRLEIVAINTANNSEYIELRNTSSAAISLIDFSIKYHNSGDSDVSYKTEYNLLHLLFSSQNFSLPDYLIQPDESFIIDQAQLNTTDWGSSVGAKINVSKVAFILYKSSIIESAICIGEWNAHIDECLDQAFPKPETTPKATSATPTIVKHYCNNGQEDYTQYSEFRAVSQYEAGAGGVEQCELKQDNIPDDDGNQDPVSVINPCALIKINEISFADPHKFIEFVNESNETISTVNCAVKRGATKSNLDRAIYLDAIFKPGEIKTFDIIGTTMTQSNANVAIAVYDKLNDQIVKIKDENGDEIAYQIQYIKVKENASYAWFDDEELTGWFQTFAPTPGAENTYQQFQNCPTDKMINPDTGNCVNIPLPPIDCPFGQYRNPETGRCKKLPEEIIYVPCQEGYYRNPETNRCRKIETETSQKECQEGWERNPETNRCRKKTDNSPAGFAVQNTGPTPESNMLIGLASGGAAVTGTLITASYRQDFMNFIRKFTRKK